MCGVAGMRPILIALLCGALIAACGGGSSSPAPDDDGGGGGDDPGRGNPGQIIPIRGGERLAWDQTAPSVQVARGYTYNLFIDGVQAALSDVRCSDTRTTAGFECSGRLPAMSAGNHTLEVAAVSGSTQGGVSVPLRVLVGGSRPGLGAASRAISCATASGLSCYEARLVASGHGTISAMRWVTPGRAFFIQDGAHVRELRSETLIPQPLLSQESPDARLVSLAAAADFERTHLAFVAWSEASLDGGELLHVTRYREVEGVFGEGATIVGNLPIPARAHVPMEIDERGLLYLALPARALPDAGGFRDAGGSILRFDASGAVPSTNPMFLAAVATGYATPSALVWDAVNDRLWLAGSDPRWRDSVLVLPVSSDGRVGQPTPPLLGLESSGLGSLPDLGLLAAQGQSRLWLVTEPGRVYRGAFGPTRSLPLTQASFEALGMARAIAEDADGRLLLVTESPASPGSWSLWSLVAKPAGQ